MLLGYIYLYSNSFGIPILTIGNFCDNNTSKSSLRGMGFLVIPEKDVPEFKKLLVQYDEGDPLEVIGTFLKERC